MLRHVNNSLVRRFSTTTMTDRTQFKEIEIPVPWGKISGKSWGDGDGHPWLGLHGWLDNCGSLDLIAKDWPAGHKIVAIDYPGHGFSSHLPEGSMYHYLEGSVVIERIRKHFKWDKFSLVGHSMGGGLSAFYSGLFPDKVDHAIMIDLVRPVCRTADLMVKRARESVDQLLSIEDRFKDDFHGKVYSTWEAAYARLKEGAMSDNTEEAVKIISERGIQKSADGNGWTFSRDMRQRVTSLYGTHPEYCAAIAGNITVNHLLIKATQSPNYESDEDIAKAMEIYYKNPKFVYREVEGNHHLHLNNPENVLPVINEFIAASNSQQCTSSL